MVRIDRPERLLALPRLGRMSSAWSRLLRSDEGSLHGVRRWAGVQEGDFYGLREWRPGDARNRIHWRTSARRRALTVRQYERRHDAGLVLIVELWEPPTPTDADRARTESVVSFAATVLTETCREAGRSVRMHVVAKRNRQVEGSGSPALLLEGQKILAAAEATTADQLPAALAAAFGEPRRQANVVIVSTRPTDLEDVERFALFNDRPDLQAWQTRCLSFSPGDARWSSMFREAEA
jgi:uncharacterized protein (DUF58 family)